MKGRPTRMAAISVNGRIYEDIHLIAFDKDGTLLDFHRLWSGRTRQWINWLALEGAKRIGAAPDLFPAFYHSLGFDPKTNRIINDSPLAVASMSKIYNIAAAVLYQHGLSWLDAEQLVRASTSVSMNALPTSEEIQPIGNVQHAVEQLRLAGIRIAIITSDDRAITSATLTLLGIENYVDMLVCGDDDTPNKPAPDALWVIGQKLDIQPSQMLMVGDTASDMVFGKNARVGGTIGIWGGAGNQKTLAETADEVISTIEEIQVINPPGCANRCL